MDLRKGPAVKRKILDERDKNFGLSEEEFNELVKALQHGNEELFERIYLAHFSRCVNYVVNHRGAEYENAYNSTLEALLEIRKKLIAGKIKYGNLAFYYTRSACMKYSKIKSKGNSNLKVKGIDDMDFVSDENMIQKLLTKELAELVNKALNQLGNDCRQLIQQYYYNELTWPEIAKIHNPDAEDKAISTKSNTLRKRMKRNCLPKFKVILKGLLG